MGHRVSYWYRLDGHKLTDELRERLSQEAEDRAREMIRGDYVSGELQCYVVIATEDSSEDVHFSGWWTIER